MSSELRRVIGFWGGTALIVGITIGSGIFRKPASLAGDVHHAGLILGLWIGFGVVSLCGALALAELSSMMPETGGVYVYLRAAYGDAAAFTFGWINLLVTSPASAGALAVFFAELLLGNCGIAPKDAPWLLPGIAAATIVILSFVNAAGATLGSAVQGLFTMIKVAALLAIAALAFVGKGSFGHFGGGSLEGAKLGAGAASVIWAYDGWVAVSMIAGEVRAPEQLLKRIIVAGMLTIVVLYVGANVAYFYAMPLDSMEAGDVPQRTVAAVVGGWGGTAVSFCIMASVFGALNGNVLARPRVSFAMAQHRLTFGFLGKSHPRWGTPLAAIAIQSAVAILLVLTLRNPEKPRELFDALTTYFVVVEWFALLFAVGTVFVLRRKRPDAERPFRTPGYPWVPLLFIVGTVAGLGAIVAGELKTGNWTPVIGLGIAMLGFPVYAIWRRVSPGPPPGGASRA